MSVHSVTAAACLALICSTMIGCSTNTRTTAVNESKLPPVAVAEDGKAADGLVMAAFPTTSEWATRKWSRNGASRGPQLAVPFALDELRSVVIGEPLDEKQAREATGGVEATELKIKIPDLYMAASGEGRSSGGKRYSYNKRYRRATLTGSFTGVIRVGGGEVQVSESGSTGHTYANCGTQESKQSLRLEAMRRRPGGGFRYEVADGYWDGVQCKAFITTRKAVDLLEIVESKAFAFIQCSDEQCSKKSLNVIFPGVDSVVTQSGAPRRQSGLAPKRVSLALRRGLAESVIATQARSGWTQSGWTQTDVTIEVQQGVSDDEPIAVAFVTYR